MTNEIKLMRQKKSILLTIKTNIL